MVQIPVYGPVTDPISGRPIAVPPTPVDPRLGPAYDYLGAPPVYTREAPSGAPPPPEGGLGATEIPYAGAYEAVQVTQPALIAASQVRVPAASYWLEPRTGPIPFAGTPVEIFRAPLVGYNSPNISTAFAQLNGRDVPIADPMQYRYGAATVPRVGGASCPQR